MPGQKRSSPVRVRLSSKKTLGNGDQREQRGTGRSPAQTSVIVGGRRSPLVDVVCTRFLPAARAYLWPAPGQSTTHARIVDSTRWRVVRLVAYPMLAGIAVFIFVAVTNAGVLHAEYADDGALTAEAPYRPSVAIAHTADGACDWEAEMRNAIHTVGEDPADWFVQSGSGMNARYAVAHLDTDTVTLNAAMPCEVVADTVRHEWVHLQQGRLYGGWEETKTAMGSHERAELAADCGSMLLGSDYLPYVADADCTPELLAEAQRLTQVVAVR
jgi:hypothetical protein